MPSYSIAVQRVFAAAHAIRLPDGSLEPLHGHNWQATVHVTADTLDQIETVMDFHDLEAAIDAVIEPAVNGNLNTISPFSDGRGGLAVNPTAERVAWWIATNVSKRLPAHARVLCVELTEAPGCSATYRP